MRFFLLLLAVATLIGCQSVGTPTSPVAASDSEDSSQAEAATVTATVTVTPTDLPTSTPAPSPTPRPITSATRAEPTPILPTTTPEATPTPQPTPSLSLDPVADGFTDPVALTHAFDERLFVAEQPGVISIVRDGKRIETPFLDITDRVGANGTEQGLLGLAFHPEYATNGRFFVNYTDTAGNTVVSGFLVSENPDMADPASEAIILTVEQPHGNHNGGNILFGPDGYLYIGMGDGGSAGDPMNHGQNPGTLLGALLRIDVDNVGAAGNYTIPPDNPYIDHSDWLPEIWSIGLRNPWRFSFDRLSGDLYIADVGQYDFEEVNFSPAGETRGLNYGWAIMEGTHCYDAADCDRTGLEIPVAEYNHTQGCSITGGYVYRGADFPALFGKYYFADYCDGTIWSLVLQDGEWLQTVALESGISISSFGEDAQGELYLLDRPNGTMFQLRP